MNCKSCEQPVHPKRIELGYRTCVLCSTEKMWSGIPITNHKTGNEIQIVKDPEVAAEFMAKSARVGFGTMRGMTTGYKRRNPTPAVKISDEVVPKKNIERIIKDRIISRRKMPHEYETVGEEMMITLESQGQAAAILCIENALEKKRIFRKHFEQLNSIIAVIASTQE